MTAADAAAEPPRRPASNRRCSPRAGPSGRPHASGSCSSSGARACDRGVFYPRVFCPHCGAGSGALEWRRASGRGTVYSAVVENRPEAAGAAFSGGQPYCVALVDLDEGVRMLTNVVGCPPEDVRCGLAVSVTWEPLSDGRQLPLFEPGGGAGA